MEGMLIFLIYSAWAVWSGFKWINGRYEWLEQPGIPNKICKALAALAAGYVVGAWTIVKWVVMIGIRITDGFR